MTMSTTTTSSSSRVDDDDDDDDGDEERARCLPLFSPPFLFLLLLPLSVSRRIQATARLRYNSLLSVAALSRKKRSVGER